MSRPRTNIYWKYKDLCDAHGVTQHAFVCRMKRKGADPMEEATRPLGIKWNQIIMPEHVELAMKNGITKSQLKNRVHIWGLDPMDAAMGEER